MKAPDANVIEVIHVCYPVGAGTEEDPIRTAEAYYTKDGRLLWNRVLLGNPYYRMKEPTDGPAS